MADGRTARPLTRLQVLRTEWLTPRMVRVIAGGPGLANVAPNPSTDAYIKLLLPTPAPMGTEPLTLDRLRAEVPREDLPVMRTYTVRWLDEQAGELALDFVYHGDVGLGGPWAAAVAPGDDVVFAGPGGGYAPDPAADWHLLAGDESALPAIASSLAAVPADTPVHVLVLVHDAGERQPLPGGPNVEVRWLHRSEGADLVDAVRALELPPGDGQAFVHGEAGAVKLLRRHLLGDRGMPRDRLSISGYWRVGRTDEQWRAEKVTEAEEDTADAADAARRA